jgi:DNA-binding response OmpR family regulator
VQFMTDKIIVVEDEPTLRDTLVYNLNRQGYVVEYAGDGKTALDKVREFKPDLIVLDIMLPVLDGFEVCRIIRSEMALPILMLTARDDEIDRVIGLEIGADDYMTKPFSMREFLARVKALLRRVRLDRAEMSVEPEKDSNEVFHAGDLLVDNTRREVLRDQEVLQLKPKEYELLLFLIRNKGKVLSRELVLERVWGWDFSGGSRTVDVHVRWLREKIELDAANPKRIITVRGGGYRFEG